VDAGLVLGSCLASGGPLHSLGGIAVLSQAAVDLFRALNRNDTLTRLELVNAAPVDYSNFFVYVFSLSFFN
jgi:hypothetical protein